MKSLIHLFVGLLLPIFIVAQTKPNKIYIFDYNVIANMATLSKPKYVSAFNPAGYVNQPFFVNGEQLLINSDHADKKFTDIYSLNLNANTIERITDTKGIAEFSPILSKDGKSIYCVRIELDGKTQTLWQYPSDKSSYGKRVANKLSTIGYFQFLDDKQIVGFTVGTPNQLGIFDINGTLIKSIDNNPGRSFQIDFAGNIYYSTLEAERQFLLKKYNKLTGIKEVLVNLPSQYFNILADGNIIISKDSKIYLFNYLKKSIDLWADLSKYNVTNISRIANKGNKLAIVAE